MTILTEPSDNTSLDELVEKPSVTLDDIAPNNEAVADTTHPRLKQSLAVASKLTGTDLPKTGNLPEGAEGEVELQNRVEEIKSMSLAGKRRMLQDVFSDPNVPQSEKRAFYEDYQEAQRNQPDIREDLAEKFLVDEGNSDSAVVEKIRDDLSRNLKRITTQSRDRQGRVQAILADSGALRTGLEIVEFFVPLVTEAQAGRIMGETDEEFGEFLSLLSAGTSKANFREKIKAMPIEERFALTDKIFEAAQDESRMFLFEENRLAVASFLETILGDEDYTSTDEWIDNIFGILDLTIIGSVFKKARTAGKVDMLTDTEFADIKEGYRAFKDNIKTRPKTDETSAYGIATFVSPTETKRLYDEIVEDPTDETAELLAGVSREDFVADANLPRLTEQEAPTNRPTIVEATDEEIARFLETRGMIELSDEELASAIATAKGRLEGVNNRRIMARPNMNEFIMDDTGFKVKAYYSAGQDGWATSQDAMSATVFALRSLGVTADDVEILARTGSGSLELVPRDMATDLDLLREEGVKLLTGEGDEIITGFVSRVNYDYEVVAPDIKDWSEERVSGLNIFDKYSAFAGNDKGSLTRHVIDPGSLFKDNIYFGAVQGIDKAAELERIMFDKSSGFTDKFVKLPKGRQKVLDQIFKEANYNSKVPSNAELTAQGVSADERAIINEWRNIWDTHYWLENRALGDSLRTQGYEVATNATGDTRLIVKKTGKNLAPKGEDILDLETGMKRPYSKADRDELYSTKDSGESGFIAALRRPYLDDDGEVIRYVAVRQEEGKSLTRRIKKDEAILNYRPMYYTTYYDANFFIDMDIKNSRGDVVDTITVGTANTVKEAEDLAARIARETGRDSSDIKSRPSKESQNAFNEDWDLKSNSGRTTQRIRGKKLVSSLEELVEPNFDNVLSPADSLIRSVRSTARNTSMRSVIDNIKARFLEQYGDILPTRDGMPYVPKNSSEILNNSMGDKRSRDAVTTAEYINFLEVGYVNAIDDGIKAAVNALADGIASIGRVTGDGKVTQIGEVALRDMAKVAPSQAARGVAFNLMLAAHPMRQILVQGSQALQVIPVFPRYSFSPNGLSRDFSMLTLARWGGIPAIKKMLEGTGKSTYLGLKPEEIELLLQDYLDSGLVASIDKQNLVRNSMEISREEANLTENPVTRKVAQTFRWMRKAGFDVGEEINIMTTWLAHRNEAVKKKGSFKLTPRELAQVAAKARNFSHGMNEAGDMPQNTNHLAAFLQFSSSPQKAILTLSTNQKLSASDKAKLIGFNTITYGVPKALIVGVFGSAGYNLLSENDDIREIQVQGAMAYSLNATIGWLTGEETEISTRSINPIDPYNFTRVIVEMLDGNMMEALESTPSGSLFMGDNSPAQNVVTDIQSILGFGNENMEQVGFGQLGKDTLSLMSGMSASFKMAYALEHGKYVSSRDTEIDEDVNKVEAIAIALGLKTYDIENYYSDNNESYGDTEDFKKDVIKFYKEAVRRTGNDNEPIEQAKINAARLNNVMQAFKGNEQRALQIMQQQMLRDLKSGQDTLVGNIIRNNGLLTEDQVYIRLRDAGAEDLAESQREINKLIDEALEKAKQEDDE